MSLFYCSCPFSYCFLHNLIRLWLLFSFNILLEILEVYSSFSIAVVTSPRRIQCLSCRPRRAIKKKVNAWLRSGQVSSEISLVHGTSQIFTVVNWWWLSCKYFICPLYRWREFQLRLSLRFPAIVNLLTVSWQGWPIRWQPSRYYRTSRSLCIFTGNILVSMWMWCWLAINWHPVAILRATFCDIWSSDHSARFSARLFYTWLWSYASSQSFQLCSLLHICLTWNERIIVLPNAAVKSLFGLDSYSASMSSFGNHFG